MALVRLDSVYMTSIVIFLIVGVFYLVLLATYRLYFSPLAKIPGPKLAALSSWYAFYHDVFRGGQYVWVITDMHKKYGPIVRIRPDTIHVNDPKMLDQVFGTGPSRSFIATADPRTHRRLRAPISPFFSKQNIRRFEPTLHIYIEKLNAVFSKHAASGSPLVLKALFTALTSDIITDYAFGSSWKSLEKEDLNQEFFALLQENSKLWHFAGYYPWVMTTIESIPKLIIFWLMPRMKVLIPNFESLENLVRNIKNSKATNEDSKYMFRSLFDSDQLLESEKSAERVCFDARVILFAGTDTTATSMSTAVFHLLSNPDCLAKLKKELRDAIPEADKMPTLQQVEKLPYLNAVIKETIRLHSPGSMRQERVAPEEDIVYVGKGGKEVIIPRGTVMAMTAPILAHDPEYYESPEEWRPERFLEDPNIEKNLLTWSRGERVCLGINLANAEMQIVIAAIFRRYDSYDGTESAGNSSSKLTLELVDKGREVVDMDAEFAVAFAKEGTKGVRLIVR